MSTLKRLSGRYAAPFMGAMVLATAAATPASAAKPLKFDMVRSAAAIAGNCLKNVKAQVIDTPLGPVERLEIRATGLPPNTEFDLFVIQVPNAPFGLAWYQGDLESDALGVAEGKFVGRFNIETFIVAQSPSAPAPVVHEHQQFPDAAFNPTTEPVHTFHLGLWFNSPDDAQKAGCPSTVTRFKGEHNAGIQVLSTRNFDPDKGPLRQLEP